MAGQKPTRQENRERRAARLHEETRLASMEKLDSPTRLGVNLLLHAAAAFVIAAFVPMFIMILPFVWLLLLVPLIVNTGNRPVWQRVQAFLWMIFIMPLWLAGMVAIHRCFAVLVFRSVDPNWANDEIRSLFTASPLDLVVAVSGIVLAVFAGLYALRVLRLQLLQAQNLAIGRAGSAAIGLAEFRGTVQPVPEKLRNTVDHSDGAIYPAEDILCYRREWTGDRISERKRWSRFYLEDASGRILVEPHDAEYWDGKVSWLFEPMRRIRLTRGERSFLNPELEERCVLRSGDPVHVVGSVEVRKDVPPDAVDSARLVLRASSERVRTTWIERLLFPSFIGEEYRRGRGYLHVFYLTDASEIDLESLLQKALRRAMLASLLWLSASAWLLVEVALNASRHGWLTH